MMGGKVAKFGIFSPAVVVAKILLGEQKLNKVLDGEGRTKGKDGACSGKRAWECDKFLSERSYYTL